MAKKYYYIDEHVPEFSDEISEDYFDEDCCYSEKYIKEAMRKYEIKELKVIEGLKYKEDQYFYCKLNDSVGEKGDNWDRCGKANCDNYEPRNKARGMCKWYSPYFYKPGESKTIKI